MKEIPLGKGRVALVDDEDYPRLSQFRWFAYQQHGTWYARRNVRKFDGRWTSSKMHREILEVPGKIDHINHNGLDNKRVNLRPCTTTENSQNGRRRSNNTSGYKGVSYHRSTGKWQSRIRINGEQKYLGVLSSPEDAARSYDTAATLYFGQFAALNFPIVWDMLDAMDATQEELIEEEAE